MWAAIKGDLSSVTALVNAGANVEEKNEFGENLVLEASRTGNQEQVAEPYTSFSFGKRGKESA